MNLDIRNADISKTELFSYAEKIEPYRIKLQTVLSKKTYEDPESSIVLPHDTRVLQQIEEVWEKTATPSLRYVLVIGIGGSNLGAKAVYDALYGSFETLEPERFPKLLFADTCDQKLLEKLSRLLATLKSPEELVTIYISKSGTTTETAVNGAIVFSALQSKGITNNRWIIITDEGSPLAVLGEKQKMHALYIPKQIGGRFSILSVAGLMPLRYLGTDLSDIQKGARDSISHALSNDINTNPAIISSAVLARQIEKGTVVHDTFIFHPELESLGKWYRQLLAESIGKEKNNTGEIVRAGILPTVSIGTTDLHSMAQLYLGGPHRSVTTFLTAFSGRKADHLLPQTPWDELIPGISKKTTSEITEAIFGGVLEAYRSQGLPFMHAELGSLSLYSLGTFMQWKMLEIMYLADALSINSFDQPSVELYKKAARRVLGL